MILNNNESSVISIGNMQKNQVSIDAKNINHIVTILSSNLYSNPKESFLRETVSNAIDSHKEAGVDEPVIITLSPNNLAIRDFGTGISPERFNEIYLNIGSSTKRESNEYIGSFGIGRFSALAVSSLVNITSFYEGKAYYYLMAKDNNNLRIDLLHTENTDEHNGVEVKIPILAQDASEYIKKFNTLSYFSNIYIHLVDIGHNYYTESVDNFNNRVIKDYRNFKCCNICNNETWNVLIGDVIYALDTKMFKGDISGNFYEFFRTVYPKFNIGDLDVTPNREAILYSDRSVNKIKEVLSACVEEVTELLNTEYARDYDDFIEYLFYNYKECNRYLNLLITDKGPGINVSFGQMRNLKSTYKGREFTDKERDSFYDVCWHDFKILAIYERGTITRTRKAANIFNILYGRWGTPKTVTNPNKILVVPSASGFSSKYLNDFLFDKYGRDKVYIFACDSYKSIIYDTNLFHVREHAPFVLDSFIRSIRDKCEINDVIHSEEYIKFKEETRKANAVDFKGIKDITYYTRRFYNNTYSSNSRHMRKAKNVTGIIDYVNKTYPKMTVIKAIEDDVLITLLPKYIRRDKSRDKIAVISVSKTNKKVLKYLPDDKFTPIEKFLNSFNHNVIKEATCLYIREYIIPDTLLKHTFMEKYRIELNSIASYLDNNSQHYLRQFLSTYITDVHTHDKLTEAVPISMLDTSAIKGARLAMSILINVRSSPLKPYFIEINDLFMYLCMKSKMFRIKYAIVKRIKSLNLKLC